MKTLKTSAGVMLALVVLSGCSTHRINKFKTFADAGKNYSDAMIELTEEAGNAAIDADSEILAGRRDDLTVEQRETAIFANTAELKNLLGVMSGLRAHTLLLKRYFTALSELAESDAPSGIAGEATTLVGNLQKLSPTLREATIGEAPVKDYIGAVVPIAVGVFRLGALERQLKDDRQALERELELQIAALTALAVEMKADLEVILNHREHHEVTKPYITKGKLPARWKKERRELLSTYVSMASADKAAGAARKLKETFIALVENKIELDDFDDLLADINAMLDLIELVQGSADNE